MYKINLNEGKWTLKFKQVYGNIIINSRVIFCSTYDFICRRILQ